MDYLKNLPTPTLRQRDEIDALLSKQAEQQKLNQDGWRVKWDGKFVVMRSGNSLWDTKGKASSGFRSSIRNDWHLLYTYMKLRTGNPNFPWHDVTQNHCEIAKELTDYLISSGKVEFVEVHA